MLLIDRIRALASTIGVVMSILSNVPNHFLRSMSPADAELLSPLLKPVAIPTGDVLYYPDDTIARVYFPNTGIVAYILTDVRGAYAEAGSIGYNGVVASEAPLDSAVAFNEAIIQAAMSGTYIETNILRPLVGRSDTLRQSLVRQMEAALGQARQIAVCNALHSIEQRLARQLLRARDLLKCNSLPLTQELLARALGVHRPSLTQAAIRLQEAGIIDYRRGNIRLLDIDALKNVSCECYGAINVLFSRLTGWSPDQH
jgi:CRP-like cAMP-binding protein